MQEAIKEFGLAHAEVVEGMTLSRSGCGVRVTESMIDVWVARGSGEQMVPVRPPLF